MAKFCPSCGAEVNEQAVVCVKCGVALQPAQTNVSGYDWLTVLLLCFFLGGFGIHNFYVKRTGIGVAQLLTLGGCGIWTLIDFIMILLGSFNDGNGQPLVRKN
ncbi:MAG: TM2 domain-containing protein [Prevotellaceae bacterium]|jgi:TM2 domain-containing membrane protein YozV|nr:TM2 domain-containing protein [Prevotellaceae bacterium]